jgi:signal transduction histidine kinase
VPVLVFAGLAALSAYRHQQTELRDVAVADARRLSEAIDRELSADLDAAQALATLPQLDNLDNLGGFEEIARRQLARHPLWLTVLLLDPQGRRMINSRTATRLGPATDMASIPAVVATRRPVIGNIAMGLKEYGIPVRVPVVRDGEMTAILTVVIRPDGLSETLLGLRLPSSWISTVIDNGGRVVARSRNAKAYVGGPASAAALAARAHESSGTYEGLTLEGIPTVSAFWKSPVYGWSVHIGMPKAGFEAPLRRSLLVTTVGFTLSLLLAGLFLALLIRELALRRREAAAVEQSQRLEALGRLTGGVAHDFNNLLMIIQGNAEILQRRGLVAAAERPLAAIREATARAARLTRELLIFARGGQAEPVVVELNATLRDFLGAVQQAVGSSVEVSTVFDENACPVEVDRVQLELAVLNLAVNARDAMAEGGVLVLATRRIPGFVQLTVSDTGPGVPEAIRSRVFDPFFTTKPQGSGTGLGLTQVYSFAKHSGGSVDLENRPGRGLSVILRLPAAQRDASPSVALPPTAAHARPLAGRRVLVLDDNPDVRDVTVTYLREHGVEVLEASTAEEGLVVLEQGGVEVVVSDIVMPGPEGGLFLAETARRRWPGLPVLLVSGYSASIAEAAAHGFRVLRKPYELSELGRLLAELLGPPGATG